MVKKIPVQFKMYYRVYNLGSVSNTANFKAVNHFEMLNDPYLSTFYPLFSRRRMTLQMVDCQSNHFKIKGIKTIKAVTILPMKILVRF